MTDKKEENLKSNCAFLCRFNQLDPRMQVCTALTLLEIAYADLRGETLAVYEVEKLTGVGIVTSSRNIHYWAEGGRGSYGGYNLVSVRIDPDDRRKKISRLTRTGRAFIDLLSELGNGEK